MNSKTFQLSFILKSSKAHVTNHFWFTFKNFDFVFWFTFLVNFSFVVCILTVCLSYDAFCCFFWYYFITIYNIEVKFTMSRPLFEQENFLQVRGTGYNLLSPVWDQKTLLNDFIDLSGLSSIQLIHLICTLVGKWIMGTWAYILFQEDEMENFVVR